MQLRQTDIIKAILDQVTTKQEQPLRRSLFSSLIESIANFNLGNLIYINNLIIDADDWRQNVINTFLYETNFDKNKGIELISNGPLKMIPVAIALNLQSDPKVLEEVRNLSKIDFLSWNNY